MRVAGVKSEVGVRPARVEDVPAMVELVRELATYERAAEPVRLTPELLEAAVFGPEPKAFAHVATVDGEVAGFALWFLSFSTWVGRHGIYLEDLYVRPEQRGKGLGKALLAELARICVERGYGRLEWAVLDWNQPAIDFYRAHGAEPQDDWTVFRLTGAPLERLAETRDPERR
jgi:GNAT superfamily N-acetyltransferase